DSHVPIYDCRSFQQQDGVVATSPLRTVAGQNIYASFLKWAESSGRPFYSFAYDWRRDPSRIEPHGGLLGAYCRCSASEVRLPSAALNMTTTEGRPTANQRTQAENRMAPKIPKFVIAVGFHIRVGMLPL